jgi:hypothetical protein
MRSAVDIKSGSMMQKLVSLRALVANGILTLQEKLRVLFIVDVEGIRCHGSARLLKVSQIEKI